MKSSLIGTITRLGGVNQVSPLGRFRGAVIIMNKNFLALCCCFLIINITFGLKPEKKYAYHPKDFELVSETKYLTTSDSLQIIAWHIPAIAEQKKNISIIISNSDAGNMSSWLAVVPGFVHAGFDVWLYDYRGFGESSDFSINSNMLYYNEFITDLSAVVNAVKSSEPKNKICLFGFSMGTIVNTLYLFQNKNDIDFYIGDGQVYSPSLVTDRLNKTGKTVLIPDSLIQDWDKFYKGIKIPVLLFCASNDIVCTKDDVAKLQEEVKNIKIVPFEGGHLQGMYILQESYFQNIEYFLAKK